MGRQLHFWVELYSPVFLGQAQTSAAVRGIRTPMVVYEPNEKTNYLNKVLEDQVHEDLKRRFEGLSKEEVEDLIRHRRTLLD